MINCSLPHRYRTVVIALLAACGGAILETYVYYLNHTRNPLEPTLNDPYWHLIKRLIFMCWLVLVLTCIWVSKKRLVAKGYDIKRATIMRCIAAGLVFCISVTALDPPNIYIIPWASAPFFLFSIDLTRYFFINTIAYTMLIYAFFSIASVERYAVALGKHVLRLLRLPGVRWAALAFISVFITAYYLSGLLFGHIPFLWDTIVEVIHAKFMSEGHLYGTSPPGYIRKFFSVICMINNGKWYSQYPPGHIMMLAIGQFLHHPEIVNPVLGACTSIAVYLLAKELYGKHVAKIAAFLSAICTYMIMLSSEYMNNATSLLMGTLFLWAYFRVLHQRGRNSVQIAGLALGFCLITRPYSAFGLCIPAAVYGAYLAIAKPSAYFKPMAGIAAIVTCFAAFLLYYNMVTTGNSLVFPYQKTIGDISNPFTLEALTRAFSEGRQHRNLLTNLERLVYFNRILFEWPLPALALVFLVYAVRGHRRDERLLFATLVSMFVSVQFIVNLDFGWGPRLVYELNGIFLVLCAKSLSILPPLLRKLSSRRHSLSYYYGSGIIILASFYVFAFQYNLNRNTVREFYAFYIKESDPAFYNTIVKNVIPPALVFVPPEQYVYVAFANPPMESSPIIFAQDWGEFYNSFLKTHYQTRHQYYVIPGNSGPIIRRTR